MLVKLWLVQTLALNYDTYEQTRDVIPLLEGEISGVLQTLVSFFCKSESLDGV